MQRSTSVHGKSNQIDARDDLLLFARPMPVNFTPRSFSLFRRLSRATRSDRPGKLRLRADVYPGRQYGGCRRRRFRRRR
jgi:hypothetical protein